MPQKKIIDISIEPDDGCKCPVPHTVSLTYDDHTKMEIRMSGQQLANVLGKQYVRFKESDDLILKGSSYSGFTFKAEGGMYRGTLNKKDVLTLFNESDYVRALIQKQESDHSNNIDKPIKNPESKKSYSCCRLFSNRAVLATTLTVAAVVAVKSFVN